MIENNINSMLENDIIKDPQNNNGFITKKANDILHSYISIDHGKIKHFIGAFEQDIDGKCEINIMIEKYNNIISILDRCVNANNPCYAFVKTHLNEYVQTLTKLKYTLSQKNNEFLSMYNNIKNNINNNKYKFKQYFEDIAKLII